MRPRSKAPFESRRRAIVLLVVAALAVAGGCVSQPATPETHAATDSQADAPGDGGVTVLYRKAELGADAARTIAAELALVRAAVARELGLSGNLQELPRAEIDLYRDPHEGEDYFLVTHARILENPLRVVIPCRISTSENDAAAIAKRFRGTVAHEIAEATVLIHVPVLDPYLRWMHDGIAESVSYRVVAALDPPAAAEERDRYLERWREARDRRNAPVRWVDLGGWRQPSNWIVHSDALFANHEPLRLADLPRSLARLSEERFAVQEEHPGSVATLDALADLLAEVWMREHLAPADGEADLRDPDGRDATSDRFKDTQFLCYGASMCVWLELEHDSPGVTGKFLGELMTRRSPVLRAGDVVAIVGSIARVDVRPRVERFSYERLQRVLTR